MTRRPCAVVLLLATLAASAACRPRSEPAGDHGATADVTPDERGSGSEIALAPIADSLRHRQPGELASVSSAPVEGWFGPGGRPFEVTLRTSAPASALARRFGEITLRTSLRTRAPDVGQYPCTSCHMGRRITMKDNRVTDAHQDIQPLHPKQTGAACATCHAPDNVERLALKSGERTSLDHAYRLCAQCHFEKADAWAGGAHGKRLDGWQGRRVVMGCADCHDPHRPELESRFPFRAPSLSRHRSPEP